MNLHHGKTVEHCVRNIGISISELARNTSVDRKTVYNWFNQKTLSKDLIQQIGMAIYHDFSTEFPSMFTAPNTTAVLKIVPDEIDAPSAPGEASLDWQDKYISLLEKHKNLLEGFSALKNKKAANQ